MKAEAQFNKRREGGIGLLHWPSHVKALSAYTLFQYCNGRSMAWKQVLDWWFCKFHEGRGAVFSNTPAKELIASRVPGRQSCLPTFFRRALHHLRELPLAPAKGARVRSKEEAMAEPLWVSPRLDMSHVRHPSFWRKTLSINTVGDLIDPFTGLVLSEDRIKRKIRAKAKVSGQHVEFKAGRSILGFRRSTYAPITTLIREYRSIHTRIGDYMLRAAASQPGETIAEEGIYSTAAESMMTGMGWERGDGLGKRGQGITEPHLPGGQVGREGLGLRSRRAPSSNKVDSRGLSTQVLGVELEEGKISYGYEGERNGQQVLEEVQCTGRGRLFRTGRVIPTERPLHTALLWDGGPVGLEELSFPHPRGWTYIGAPIGQTLEHMTIKTLTSIFKQQVVKRPSCEAAWPKALD